MAELFDGRSQLLVYHLMFGPDDEAACPGCSFASDHWGGAVVHLNQHDVTFVCASRAPLPKLQAYKRRMGWSFPWVSSYGTDFNLDFGLFTEEEGRAGAGFNFGTPRRTDLRLAPVASDGEELMGMSAFALSDGAVYHTYSCYDRAPMCSTTPGSSSTGRRRAASRRQARGCRADGLGPPPRRVLKCRSA